MTRPHSQIVCSPRCSLARDFRSQLLEKVSVQHHPEKQSAHSVHTGECADCSASLAARRARSASVPENWRMNERLPMASCHVQIGLERTCRVHGTTSHHHPRLGRVQPRTLLLVSRTSSHLSRRLSRCGGSSEIMSSASRSAACSSQGSEIVIHHDRLPLGLVGFDPDRAERRVQ